VTTKKSVIIDHLATIAPIHLPMGAQVRITRLLGCNNMPVASYEAFYVGEIDSPIETLEDEIYQFFATVGMEPEPGARMRTSRFYIPVLDRSVTAEECVWERVHASA
jgi:hypothetical protein